MARFRPRGASHPVGNGIRLRAVAVKTGTRLPIVFIVPPMAVLGILALVPTIDAINIALQNRELSNPDSQYVWLANFEALFGDKRFLNAMWVSLIWEILTVSATMTSSTNSGTPRARSCAALRRKDWLSVRRGA